MSVKQFLRNIPLFQGLEDHDLAALDASAHTRIYRRGDPLPQPEHPGQIISFVEQGAARRYRVTAEGRELTVDVHRAGGYFVQSATDATDVPRSLVEALADKTIVHRFPLQSFNAVVTRYPPSALALIEQLASRLREAHDRLEYAALHPVESNLAYVLLRLATDRAQPAVDASPVELAAYVGSSRERITRILREWQRAGLVCQPSQRQVRILDRRRLEVLGS